MKDNVWFTYKARIQANKRLEWLDFHSQMLLVWYVMLSTFLAVLSIRYEHILGPNTDVMATILSVALLGVSLAVTNRDFRGRAMTMRSNYLQLQKLYNDLSVNMPPTQDQINRYHDLLAESENHHEIDDRIARVFASNLSSRKPTRTDLIYTIYWLCLRF
ncbi:SLATT domain-containing protein, partial [Salmonella enterica]|nr:SLATT domain-containing protein [Salmonella enterica]